MAKSKRCTRRYHPSVAHLEPRRLLRPKVEIDRGLAWFVVWCAGGAGKRAQRELAAAGLQTYLPMESIEMVRRGRATEVERTPLGRYLFVGLNAARPQFAAVREALDGRSAPSGDFSFLWHGQDIWVPARNIIVGRPLGRLLLVDDVPLRVPVKSLHELQDRLSGFSGTQVRKSAFAAGDRFRVTDGAFTSYVGIVESSDDYRVRALLDIFGRKTSVEFEVGQLEVAA